jgi:hypothetical protein
MAYFRGRDSSKDVIMKLTKGTTYALEFYEEMFKRSKVVDSRSVPELRLGNIGSVRLYHGKLNDIANALRLTKTQSYNASGLLQRIQSVTRLAASTPQSDGYWQINFEPTAQHMIDFFNSNKSMTRKIAPSRIDILLSELADLRARVTELEKRSNEARNNVRGSKKMS